MIHCMPTGREVAVPTGIEVAMPMGIDNTVLFLKQLIIVVLVILFAHACTVYRIASLRFMVFIGSSPLW